MIVFPVSGNAIWNPEGKNKIPNSVLRCVNGAVAPYLVGRGAEDRAKRALSSKEVLCHQWTVAEQRFLYATAELHGGFRAAF